MFSKTSIIHDNSKFLGRVTYESYEDKRKIVRNLIFIKNVSDFLL